MEYIIEYVPKKAGKILTNNNGKEIETILP